MIIRLITILWLLFMLILSHIGGKASGAESRWLSQMTGVKEGTLRRSAHVILYLVLGILVSAAWPDTAVWVRAAVLALVAVIDETSKALPVFPGRHCSAAEIWLNLGGAAIGLMLGQLISSMI